MRRDCLSAPRLLLVATAVLVLATAIGWIPSLAFATTSPSSATTSTIVFDFDTGLPTLSEGQNTPLNQTSGGVTAYFSSLYDPAAFSVQSYDTTFFKLSQFSGKYLYDNNPLRNSLDIKFDVQLISINLTFTTIEYHGGPDIEPSNITLTAYINSTATPVGSATAHGIWPTNDSYPQGTLSFNSHGQSFNLIRIELPYQRQGATDFLVDNLIVTEMNPVPEFPSIMILPLFVIVTTFAIFIAKRKFPKIFK